MACRADRIVDQMVFGTRADLSPFVSVTQSVSLRVVCIRVIDAASGSEPGQPERRSSRVQRQALPAAIASVAVPVAAASLALAAAPLLRRLPDRFLPPDTAFRAHPLVSGVTVRIARLRRPVEPLPLDAGQPVPDPDPDEEMETSIDAAIAALMVEGDGPSPAPEPERLALAGVAS